MTYSKIAFSLLFCGLLLAGCGKHTSTPETNGSPEAPSQTSSAEPAGHTHGAGPNGGVVFDLGSQHAEFTVDHGKQQCTILVLGADEKSPLPVAAEELTLSTKETKTADGTVVAPMTITLVPQEAADGKASTFVGTDPGMANVADFEGTVVGLIDGKPAQGEFKE
ncbi:MAG: hypothetical protein AB7U73_03210 [Pirellulales bacterium]